MTSSAESGDDRQVPVWLLDVDGVVNAFDSDAGDRFQRAVANGFVITWDPTLTDRLHSLHADRLLEIRWLTTWGEDANARIAPLFGWSEFVVSGAPELGLEWWKLRHAVAVVENEQRRLIWTDDDIKYDANALAWLASLRPHQAIWFASDPAQGLTHADIDAIEFWLTGVSDA